MFERLAREDLERQARQTPDSETEARLARELADLDARGANLVQLAGRGMGLDLIADQLEEVDRERGRVRGELQRLRQRRPPVVCDPATARQSAERLRRHWQEIEENPALLQRVLQTFVRVTLWPDQEPTYQVLPQAWPADLEL